MPPPIGARGVRTRGAPRAASQRVLQAARILAIAGLLLGASQVLGWISGAVPARSAAGALTVKTNMAVGQLLMGLALWLALGRASSFARRATAFACAFLVFLTGALTLAEHITGADLGIDQILASEAPGAAGTSSPNRMGPPGSTSLALLGLGGMALAARRRRWIPHIGIAVFAVNLVPAVGFIYGIDQFYRVPDVTGIAWPTVLALTAMGAALVLARHDGGPMALLQRRDAGGTMLRRMLPGVLLITFAFGFVEVRAAAAGLLDDRLRMGVLVIALAVFFSLFLWQSAIAVSASVRAQRRSALALEESRRRLEILLERLPAVLWTNDRGYRITFIVGSALASVGRRPEQIEGRTLMEVLGTDDPAHPALDGVGRALHGESVSFVVGFAARVFQAHVRPLETGSGRGSETIGVAVDVSEMKRLEEELRQWNALLERRVEQRTAELKHLALEMSLVEQRERAKLARLLHDHLQQLLVAARMHVAGLGRRPVHPAEIEERLATVDDLLGQSIEATRTLTAELNPPVLARQGLGAALRWLARWMREKHEFEVELALDPAADRVGEAARTLLFQSVRELLFNVVKHAGVRRALVAVSAEDRGSLRVEVSDEGPGFDGESLEENMGAGLMNIRQRVEAMAGALEISADRGTRVALTIPLEGHLAPVSEAEVVPVEEAMLLAEATPSSDEAPAAGSAPAAPRLPARAPGAPIRVLLVDDHPIVREGLAGLVRAHGDLELAGEAADGAAAVEEARRLQPEVIVMDVSMPVMDGIEATRRIVAEQPGVRVIALSTYEQEDRAGAARDAGAVAYLTKDCSAEALLRTIRRAVAAPPAIPAA